MARVIDGPARPGVQYDDRGPNLVGRYYVPHEARHTTATILLEAGVSEHVVIAIMGHASIITSRGYQHVSQSLARRALDDVAGRLGLVAG
ncbi:tyrosine-type recombinase/integrase [Isoptericola sp. NPDC058082]|uniref:tyrosine-type recombinase/integrase n=1 Tax=Isoptericola sp. NPDC058082 TaxID=3346331 RepID=UPI0036E8BACF